ncbi:MAG: prepilin peptidase, partial [Pseudomonadota bacterium]
MELLDPLAHQPLSRVTLAIVLGLLVGSFLNVVVYRLPLMLQRGWRNQCLEFLELDESRVELKDPMPDHVRFSLSSPGSHCPRCNAPVRAWQNIPILSYLWLRGRCASCRQRIPLRYPLVEATSATLVALVAWSVSDPVDLLMLMILTWSLLALSLIDFDHQLLPDDITLPLLWLGLVLSVAGIGTGVSPADSVLGAALGYMTLWSVYWLFRLATGREGMGYGDFKLLAALGAWLGWQNLL